MPFQNGRNPRRVVKNRLGLASSGEKVRPSIRKTARPASRVTRSVRRVAGRDDERGVRVGLTGAAACGLVPAGDGSGDDRPLVPVDGMRREDRAILILGERAALDHGVELVAPPAAEDGEAGGREDSAMKSSRGRSVGGARGEVDGADDREARVPIGHARELARSTASRTRGAGNRGSGRVSHLRRQLLLERPGRASAIAVQLPGPPSFWICSRRSASSCGIRRGVFGEGQHDDVHGDLRPRNTSRRCRGARNPDRSTPSSWRKTFPNGGLPRLGLAAPWPGRGSAPGNGAHLGSPRVLHDLVVVIGHVAHRRVRRVRRVRGGVWPRGFRGKFLTDCVTVRWKPDAEKRNQGSDEKMLGRACSTFLPHCLFIRDRSRLFVHQKNLILDSNAKLTIPPRHYWHLTTKKCFLRRKANCLSGRPTFG